jgi:hypothetical protein
MSDPTERKDLLGDVFAEGASGDFREALLGEMLGAARRRRRFRKARGAVMLLALALCALLVISTRHRLPRQQAANSAAEPAENVSPPQTAYRLIRSEPLPEDHIIKTRPFSNTGDWGPEPAFVAVTTISGGYRKVTDDQLLGLLAGRPALLVRTGPHSEGLVFVNPRDQEGFPAN